MSRRQLLTAREALLTARAELERDEQLMRQRKTARKMRTSRSAGAASPKRLEPMANRPTSAGNNQEFDVNAIRSSSYMRPRTSMSQMSRRGVKKPLPKKLSMRR